MKLYGLMITKNDHEIFAEWCRDQLPLYDAVVCLDGSDSDRTANLAAEFRSRLIYLHERDYSIAHQTDHGLRQVVHQEIVRRFGIDNWVMCCHADEFCYHDPRKVVQAVAPRGYNLVGWHSLHFVPHPSELPDWARRCRLPVRQRFRHYHWDYRSSGLPWVEDRLYRNGPLVAWDSVTHGSVRPCHLDRVAPVRPILCHYKVFTTELGWYQPEGGKSFFRHHWAGQRHRTGLPFRVERPEDLFVDAYPDYGRCDCFDGAIRQPWNIGEEFRPDSPAALPVGAG